MKKVLNTPWLAEILAILAVGWFLFQALNNVQHLKTVEDEGQYLVKGYAFATGECRPFQDDGFWNNQMPLAFLVPGMAQRIFGRGLDAGRYFSAGLGLGVLLGMWILGKRLRGRWGGAFAVAALALNPITAQYFAAAVSQPLVALLLTWMLVLGLGEDRKPWQTSGAAVLGGLLLMTRINLAPLLALYIVLVFWQHGKKAGWYALSVGAGTVLLGHALFWPGILRIWAYWLPGASLLVPERFLAPANIPLWNPEVPALSRLLSLASVLRYHFLALAGFLASLALWPKRMDWKSRDEFKMAVFLAASFGLLFAMHAWATLGKNYCVFCLAPYTAFFSSLAILLVLLTFPYWGQQQLSHWRTLAIAAAILVLAAGIGFATFEESGNDLIALKVPVLDPQAEGWLTKRRVRAIINDYRFVDPAILRRALPTTAGALVGLGVLLAAAIVKGTGAGRKKAFGSTALLAFLVTGSLLMPTWLMGQGGGEATCEEDVPGNYARMGEELSAVIPPGASVYLKSKSALPLVYLEGVRYFPPQVNGIYTYYLDGKTEELQRYGFWNRELDERWMRQADFVVIDERIFSQVSAEPRFHARPDPALYEEILRTRPQEACDPASVVGVYRRISR
jgi:4-amino-4-deoxy-L-arabinose transferase-like glycosyltransferase